MSSDPFELALCRGYDPDLWFPEPGARSKADIRIQVKICTECPVRDACIELAEKTELGPAISRVTVDGKGGILFFHKHFRGEARLFDYRFVP